ncbi:MAG TPA: nitronate monooxygenase [Dehalococcoidia bacterium]|nr:nitronate monooxygenase [Dehalococcoidia bacterium]
MKRTRICELLGIEYPIIQAPMNWLCGAELVAAVSNAGALGTLGPNAGAKTITTDVVETGERLRSQIRKVKSLTNKPFAVNVTVGSESNFSDREFSKQSVGVILEEGVPAVCVSVGGPQVYTKVLKEAGIKVLHAVSNARYARRAEEEGVDAVIAEGFEAGGYKGFDELPTMVLIPLVADAVKIPIVAGGGIVDARSVAAALVLGADAVYMGTRFFATKESDAHPKAKELIVQAKDTDTVSVRKQHMMLRALKNDYTTKALEILARPNAMEELAKFDAEHSIMKGTFLGDVQGSMVPSGAGAGLISDIPSAAEVIQNIVKVMDTVLERLK